MTAAGPASSIHHDLASAYLAAGAKVASWVIVSGLVYRLAGADGLAMLALARLTIGILNYTSLGLPPAMIRLSAGNHDQPDWVHRLYASAMAMALISAGVGLLIIILYAAGFDHLHRTPHHYLAKMPWVVLGMGLGQLLRLASEPAGAILQTRGRIALDNYLAALGELCWIALSLGLALAGLGGNIALIAIAYGLSGLVVLLGRTIAVGGMLGRYLPMIRLADRSIIHQLMGFGVLVMVAQLADYLYAPTDFILINRLLSDVDAAAYAPAVQIDSGLALLVSGLAGVLLPRTARAQGSGDIAAVRRYYLVGTLASAMLLTVASLAVWIISPWLLKRWLGQPLPQTLAILPLVLIHTVIGGSSAVGRSVLLGMGKVRPFTIAALTGGACNVILSYVLVRYCHWGLAGIVAGTIVAVTARCLVWMPWYINRHVLRVNV